MMGPAAGGTPDALSNLLTLITDPVAAQARIEELRTAEDDLAKARATFKEEREKAAEREAWLSKAIGETKLRECELNDRAKVQDEREEALTAWEAKLDARDKRQDERAVELKELAAKLRREEDRIERLIAKREKDFETRAAALDAIEAELEADRVAYNRIEAMLVERANELEGTFDALRAVIQGAPPAVVVPANEPEPA